MSRVVIVFVSALVLFTQISCSSGPVRRPNREPARSTESATPRAPEAKARLGNTLPAATEPRIPEVAVDFDSVGLDLLYLVFRVTVANPTASPLRISAVAHEIRSGSRVLGDGWSARQETVAPGQSVLVTYVVTVPFVQVMGTVQGTRPGMVVPYAADIRAEVEGAGGKQSLLHTTHGEFPMPAAPLIESLRATSAAGGATFELTLRNPNEFPLDLDGFVATVAIGGVIFQVSELNASGTFGPGESAPLRILGRGGPLPTAPTSAYKLDASFGALTPFGKMSLPINTAGQTSQL